MPAQGTPFLSWPSSQLLGSSLARASTQISRAGGTWLPTHLPSGWSRPGHGAGPPSPDQRQVLARAGQIRVTNPGPPDWRRD
jgi:hypothetical protein